MSKRAEDAASRALPNYPPETYADKDEYIEVESERSMQRAFYQRGYEQAEKDTTDRAAKWIREHWREYVWGPDADGCIGFGLWENDFRKAMEEE